VNKKDYVDYDTATIIAHSTGGLVARAYIEDVNTNNQQRIDKFVTLATPHKGLLAAYRGWYGGDPGGMLSREVFKDLLIPLAVCDRKANQFVSHYAITTDDL
jgi:hypothetical protein